MKKYQITIRDSSGNPTHEDEIEANSPKEAYDKFVDSNKSIPYRRVFVNWGMFGAEGYDPPHYEGHEKEPTEIKSDKPKDIKSDIANTPPQKSYSRPSLTYHRDNLRDSTAYPVLRIINLLNSIAIIVLALIWGGQVSGEAAFVFGLVGVVIAILNYSVTSVFFDVADSNINTSRNTEPKD